MNISFSLYHDCRKYDILKLKTMNLPITETISGLVRITFFFFNGNINMYMHTYFCFFL